MTDRFLIAPISTGLETDLKPFLIPDDAFSTLTNAYVYRGRIRKRFGSELLNGSVDPSVAQLYSRFRINLGNTDVSGNISVTVPGAVFKIGQLFSIDDEIFTVVQTGTPGTLKTTGAASLATYNTTTGALVINGAAASTATYFYPAEPVMGLISYETNSINDEPTYGFDTQFAYQYTSGAWERLGTAVWTGNNTQFFWGYTYRGTQSYEKYLYVTNFNAADQIKYWTGSAWTTINPAFNSGGDTIESARIIVAFHDRLLFLNTVENISGTNRSFVNRCRFSQNGDPVAADAWREDIPGKGGYIDNLATQEQIVTVEFLKDRLIVGFERSTWELVYIGNEILPFRWQQINTELGYESTFSIVPFDQVVLGIANVGIHACNGINVQRIDEKIPDEVFNIEDDNQGVQKVYGIRDYKVEMVYWTFPSDDTNDTYPTRVLVYNYRTGSWAFNEDSITCFGYFQNSSDLTWETTNTTWEESEESWNSGTIASKFRQVLAGNQEGFTFIIDPDQTRNAPALQITNITYSANVITLTIIDHNLHAADSSAAVGDYIILENIQASGGSDITNLNGNIYPVNSVVSSNSITILSDDVTTGTYLGGGTVARVSNLNIQTKQYNFYLNKGRNVNVNKVDFYVDRTTNGEVTVSYSPSSSIILAPVSETVLETSPYSLYPLEFTMERLWHPIYIQAEGECIQLRIYMSDEQLRDSDIAWSDFELNAMIFHANPTSSRLQ